MKWKVSYFLNFVALMFPLDLLFQIKKPSRNKNLLLFSAGWCKNNSNLGNFSSLNLLFMLLFYQSLHCNCTKILRICIIFLWLHSLKNDCNKSANRYFSNNVWKLHSNFCMYLGILETFFKNNIYLHSLHIL